MNITWDAERYTSDFSFVPQYGNDVLEWLDAGEGGTVLDLGCGNGALSRALQEKGYLVKGMDASQELLEIARRRFPDLEFIQADAVSFSLEEPVDAVFSNAVFHWIEKERQQQMLRCVHRALKPNGQFVFEFGGYGNNRLIHGALERIFDKHTYSYKNPFYFPSISEYTALLEAAGFQTRLAALFDRPTELKGEQGLKDWVRMFLKTPFSGIAGEGEKEAILDEVEEELRDSLYQNGRWYADYVRLRIKAVRL